MIPEDYKESKGCHNCSKCFMHSEYPMTEEEEYFCTEDSSELPFTDEELDNVFDLPSDREKGIGERNKLWHKLGEYNWDWKESHRVQPQGICSEWEQACIMHSWLDCGETIGCERCGEER